jgi:hypothetical protein
MRLEPRRRAPQQQVHPWHDWFFVIEGHRGHVHHQGGLTDTGEAGSPPG